MTRKSLSFALTFSQALDLCLQILAEHLPWVILQGHQMQSGQTKFILFHPRLAVFILPMSLHYLTGSVST